MADVGKIVFGNSTGNTDGDGFDRNGLDETTATKGDPVVYTIKAPEELKKAQDEIARLRAENERLLSVNGQLAFGLAETDDRATQAEAQAAAVVGALEEIVQQKLYREMSSEEYETADFMGGYEACVITARKTLATLPVRARAMAKMPDALKDAIAFILAISPQMAGGAPGIRAGVQEEKFREIVGILAAYHASMEKRTP